MQKLTAKQDILFESKIYAPGEELPTKSETMVKAWLEAGTAVWIDDESKIKAPKASPKTAEAGLPGVAVASESEDGDNLSGKVPKTAARSKEKKK